jgi:hypothetical protein
MQNMASTLLRVGLAPLGYWTRPMGGKARQAAVVQHPCANQLIPCLNLRLQPKAGKCPKWFGHPVSWGGRRWRAGLGGAGVLAVGCWTDLVLDLLQATLRLRLPGEVVGRCCNVWRSSLGLRSISE